MNHLQLAALKKQLANIKTTWAYRDRTDWLQLQEHLQTVAEFERRIVQITKFQEDKK